MRVDFSYQRPRSWLGRTIAIMQLLYNNTVREQRKASRIPVMGLVKTVGSTIMIVGIFYMMFTVVGIRSSPVRGNLVLFLLTGILGYINHLKGFSATSGAPASNSSLMQHQPMTSFIAIVSATLSALYTVAISTILVLFLYDQFLEPLKIYHVVGFATMMGLACISGACVGLVFYGGSPFSPFVFGFGKNFYRRISMIASGKMFLANAVPQAMYPFLSWHPLFHINDQGRGYAFNNYFPQKTDLGYALTFMAVCFVIGLLLLFVAQQRASLSWGSRAI